MRWHQKHDLIRREDVIKAIEAEFGMRFGDRMFTHAVRAIGFKPTATKTLSDKGQRGRVGEFDPILALLIASVNDRCKGRLESMDNALDPYRVLWDQVKKLAQSKSIPKFTEDREYGAWLLMLTSEDYGMAPIELYDRLQSSPGILELSRFGREYVENLILGYKQVYIAALEMLEFDDASTELKGDRRRLWWANTWISQTAPYFGDPEADS